MDPKNASAPGGQRALAAGVYSRDELAPGYVRTLRETDRETIQAPLHAHPFLELAFVRSCQEAQYIIGSSRYRLCPGDVLIIPPDTLHGAERTGDGALFCHRDVVWISPHLLNRLEQMHPNRRFQAAGDIALLRTQGTAWAFLGELFRQGIEERESQAFGWEGMVLGNAMVLLTQVTRAMLDKSLLVLREEKSDLLLRLVDYLETHLGEKLTLESVAAEFDVSKSTVSQLFRKGLDVSFYAYLTRRRLIHARGLIAGGIPLEQVGKMVGFKEHSAFYRAFRQEYGISPKEYRACLEPQEP